MDHWIHFGQQFYVCQCKGLAKPGDTTNRVKTSIIECRWYLHSHVTIPNRSDDEGCSILPFCLCHRESVACNVTLVIVSAMFSATTATTLIMTGQLIIHACCLIFCIQCQLWMIRSRSAVCFCWLLFNEQLVGLNFDISHTGRIWYR